MERVIPKEAANEVATLPIGRMTVLFYHNGRAEVERVQTENKENEEKVFQFSRRMFADYRPPRRGECR